MRNMESLSMGEPGRSESEEKARRILEKADATKKMLEEKEEAEWQTKRADAERKHDTETRMAKPALDPAVEQAIKDNAETPAFKAAAEKASAEKAQAHGFMKKGDNIDQDHADEAQAIADYQKFINEMKPVDHDPKMTEEEGKEYNAGWAKKMEAAQVSDKALEAVDPNQKYREIFGELGSASQATIDNFGKTIKEKFGVDMENRHKLGMWAKAKLDARKLLNKELSTAMKRYDDMQDALGEMNMETALDAQPKSYFAGKRDRQVTKGRTDTSGGPEASGTKGLQ